MARVTAVFANHAQADAAIAELRRRGVSDSHLSIVAKRVDEVEVNRLRGDHRSDGGEVLRGAGAGDERDLALDLSRGLLSDLEVLLDREQVEA